MLLSIKDLEVRKLPFAGTWQPGEIDFSDSGTTQSGPLTAQGEAELLAHSGGEVRVKGQVATILEAECDRCLGTATFSVDTPFDLFYRLLDPKSIPEDEVAIDEGEAEMGFYELPGLELEEILREQVLLQLPMQRVCREDCKGICLVCGGNRNETDCQCKPDAGDKLPEDDRWGALKSVHFEHSKN
jgi:uncharacterized protein